VAEKVLGIGLVVDVETPDPNGHNLKRQPAVILDVLPSGDFFLLVASTTNFNPNDLQYDEIKLPFGNALSPSRTGLVERSVAKCTWHVVASREAILVVRGAVPTILHNAILNRVNKIFVSDPSAIRRVNAVIPLSVEPE
jgi:hypothetical protein